MKTIEQWEQSAPDRDWDNLPQRITCHQKVGTVIPFSKTVDKDPNPRIPLSVPENSYPVVGKGEKLFGWATVVVIVVLAVWGW